MNALPARQISRRNALQCLAGLLAAPAVARARGVSPPRRRRILLRSSWQALNIGDIAHTPGMLTLIERHLPEADVTLWPSPAGLELGVEALLRQRFPRLHIADSPAAQAAAIADCDFFLHGSGPFVIAGKEIERWLATGKPYGIGGVSMTEAQAHNRRHLLAPARFVFARDSVSLAALRSAGITGPRQEFGPDATFAVDLRAETCAARTLAVHRLEPGRFLCVIPKLRSTPYWELYDTAERHPKHRLDTPEEIAAKTATNERFKEIDSAKLRAAIVAWVRNTGCRVLLCPELTYEVELTKPLLFDPLPADVKPFVENLGRYWLTDEAGSVYAHAAAVLSLEMHSPIIAVAHGTPAVHVMVPGDGSKGTMWSDVGLGEWLFQIDDIGDTQLADAIMKIYREPMRSRELAREARQFAHDKAGVMMAELRQALYT